MLKAVIALTALAAAGSAQAATVLFADTFDGEGTVGTSTLNYAGFANWTVAGTVDLVQSGQFSIDCVGGTGKCVDLDGSRQASGTLLSKEIAFAAGRAVTVSFDVSGNQRNATTDMFIASTLFTPVNGGFATVLSGPASFTNTALFDMLNMVSPYQEGVVGTRDFVTYSYTFTANLPGVFQLGFATTGNDNVGPILDNVLVTQAGGVPEPATWAMLIAGFGLVGATARRRRTTSVTA
jgi:hypothetical protein